MYLCQFFKIPFYTPFHLLILGVIYASPCNYTICLRIAQSRPLTFTHCRRRMDTAQIIRLSGHYSEKVQHIVQIDFLPYLKLILGLRHIIEQEFQDQGAAQPPAFNLEMGKAHWQVGVHNIVGADESGVCHCF